MIANIAAMSLPGQMNQIERSSNWVQTITCTGEPVRLDTSNGRQYIVPIHKEPYDVNDFLGPVTSALSQNSFSMFIENTGQPMPPQSPNPPIVAPERYSGKKIKADTLTPDKILPKRLTIVPERYQISYVRMMSVRHLKSNKARKLLELTKYYFHTECKRLGVFNWNKRGDKNPYAHLYEATSEIVLPESMFDAINADLFPVVVLPVKILTENPFDTLDQIDMAQFKHHEGISLQTDERARNHMVAQDSHPTTLQLIYASRFMS
jgi:hypothetical protein